MTEVSVVLGSQVGGYPPHNSLEELMEAMMGESMTIPVGHGLINEGTSYKSTINYNNVFDTDRHGTIHGGVDFAYIGYGQGENTSDISFYRPEVKSPISGILSYSRKWGRVTIQDDFGFYHDFFHLEPSTIDMYVSQGERVDAGEVIGALAGTGPSGVDHYKPHIHYQIRTKAADDAPLEHRFDDIYKIDPTEFWKGGQKAIVGSKLDNTFKGSSLNEVFKGQGGFDTYSFDGNDFDGDTIVDTDGQIVIDGVEFNTSRIEKVGNQFKQGDFALKRVGGNLEISKDGQTITIENFKDGDLNIDLDVVEALDAARFEDWMADSGLDYRLYEEEGELDLDHLKLNAPEFDFDKVIDLSDMVPDFTANMEVDADALLLAIGIDIDAIYDNVANAAKGFIGNMLGAAILGPIAALVDFANFVEGISDFVKEIQDAYNDLKDSIEDAWDDFWGNHDYRDYSNRTRGKYKESGDGRDTLIGSDFSDTLFGNGDEDYIDGGLGNDFLYGGADEDTIYGGEGDDYIQGKKDKDTIFGGSGNDTIYGAKRSKINNKKDWSDKIDGGTGNDLIYSGRGNDTVEGGDGNDTIYAGTWNDIVDGGSGDDTIYGETGHDRILGGIGNDLIDGGNKNDSLYGNAGNDTIYGDTGDDAIWGGANMDTLHGGSGDDVIYGGSGSDSISGGSDNDYISGGSGNDTVDGGAGDDRLIGGIDDDSIDGGAGDDTLIGGLGTDTLIGGEGEDRYVFNEIDMQGDTIIDVDGRGRIVVDGTEFNTQSIQRQGGVYTQDGFELIKVGGDLRIQKGNRHILLKGFRDGFLNINLSTLYSEADIESVENWMADAGLDYRSVIDNERLNLDYLKYDMPTVDLEELIAVSRLEGGQVEGALSEMKASTVLQDIIESSRDRASGRNQFKDYRDRTGGVKVKVGSGDDTVVGSAYRDKIYSDKDDDLVYGMGGNDYIKGDNGDDEIYGGSGHDRIHGGRDNDTIFGDDDNDTIYGDSGIDLIWGGSGNDYLNGGSGDDVIYGGSGNDRIIGSSNQDYLVGNSGEDTLYGDSGHDTLLGGSGDDYLNGGSNEDEIYGGSGNDRIKGEGSDDLIEGNGGNDEIWAGSSEDTVDGGSGNDTIYGDKGHDIIKGGIGNDRIYGGKHNDTINGGHGRDWMKGEWGKDVFVFEHLTDSVQDQADTIADFKQGHDQIDLSNLGLSGYEALSFDAYSGGMLLGIDGTDFQVELAGVTKSLVEADFIF